MSNQLTYTFQNKQVHCLMDEDFSKIRSMAPPEQSVIITDYQVYKFHHHLFQDYPVIKFPSGEAHKNQDTVNDIIRKLLELKADRDIHIVAVGGGVVTDIAGFVSSIYKRGTKLTLVPTTILAMVDAAIGGKNGINTGLFKNTVGTISQPDAIWYDYRFLQTLPAEEWINGFAEIIKHACIKDELMFRMLEKYSLHDFQTDLSLTASLIERNVQLKMDIVTVDEFEKGERKCLNFGHTIGHAIENLHNIPHGHAVSIGMVAACNLSVRLQLLNFAEGRRVVSLLTRYHLPVDIETVYEKVMDALQQDKKRAGDALHFILLNHIGEAVIRPVLFSDLTAHLNDIL